MQQDQQQLPFQADLVIDMLSMLDLLRDLITKLVLGA
jgi:hypothetical protein